MFLEIIIEDQDGGEADLTELQSWADTYGLTMPVLSDPGSSVLYSFASGSIGLPFTVLIDRGVVVADANYPSTGDMDALLAE